MWRVSALDRDGREIGHLELADGELTIGRDADRQLILPSASVSRRHARIVFENGRPCIVDEGSSNGVLINGVRITGPTPIGPSTRIDVAEFRIAIEPVVSSDGVAPLPPIESPVSQPAGGMPMVSAGASGLRLVAEGGPYDGRMFNLPPGVTSVGRAVDNELVFDDPSLSRKHARVHRESGRLEVEDLGSSNGTFVNGRRIGRGAVSPGDVVRFGDLSFRCEGGLEGSTRSVEPGMERLHFYALVGGAGLTFTLLVLAIVFLVRKVPPVQASGREAIARIARAAETHVQSGRKLYEQRRYTDAKGELDQALELDPGNLEARRLARLAARGPDDDRAVGQAQSGLLIGDRRGLEQALTVRDALVEGSNARAALDGKLEPALVCFGSDSCGKKALADCAWALCKAFETAPADSKPSAVMAQKLREAERKLKREHGFQACRAKLP
ncbi:MAG: FHA domain-containing protein [Polyangia bacterium]